MTFGEKLQTLRAREGLSQDALAEALDVSRQAVSKWERDEAMPEAEKIVRISRRFGVTTDYLLLEDAPERPGSRTMPEPGEVWRKYGFLLGWAGRLGLPPAGADDADDRRGRLGPGSFYLLYLRLALSVHSPQRRPDCLPVVPGGCPSASPCGPGADALERTAFGGTVPEIPDIPAVDVLFRCDSGRRETWLRWPRTLVVYRHAGPGSSAVAMGQHKKIKNAAKIQHPGGLPPGHFLCCEKIFDFPLDKSLNCAIVLSD